MFTVSFIDGLKLRNKILLPLAILVVVALGQLAYLGLAYQETTQQFKSLIYGPRLAARIAVTYSGYLSEVGRLVNLFIIEGDAEKTDAFIKRMDGLKEQRAKARGDLEALLPQYAEDLGQMKSTAATLNDNILKLAEMGRKRNINAEAASRIALGFQGQLSELGRVVNLFLLEAGSADIEQFAKETDALRTARTKSRNDLQALLPKYPEVIARLQANGAKLNEDVATLIDMARKRRDDADGRAMQVFWATNARPVLADQRKVLGDLSAEILLAANGEEMRKFWEEVGRPVLSAQREKLATIADAVSASSNATTEELVEATTQKIQYTIGGSLGVMLLITLIVIMVVRAKIVSPLQVLTVKTVRLSTGDDDFELPELTRSDEYGDLARALKVFKDNADKIRAMSAAEAVTKEIGDVITRAANKDFSAHIDTANMEGFLKDIGSAVNNLLAICNQAFKDFREKATHTAHSVDEASTAVGQVSDGARAQNLQLSQVSTALTESAHAIRIATSNASSAREQAEASAKAVEQGQQAVAQLEPIVEAISQNSRKINQITQVISQIANRTHILSLNAAIEAARAGEHGKGFVVVAQEVGKLAESAAQNAKQITDIVEFAANDAQQGKVATRTVADLMNVIAAGAKDTTEMVRSIAVTMDEQQATVSQIEGNVADLKNIAMTNSASAEEITATMVQLSNLSNDMRHKLEEFKTA